MTDTVANKTCPKHGSQGPDDYYIYNRGTRIRYICKKYRYTSNEEYRKANRDYCRKYWKLYSNINANRIKAKYQNLRLMILKHYSEELCCEICKENNLEFLAIDHKFGGGQKHRREIGTGGKRIYNWIKKNNFPPEFRVLCHNCNLKYRDNKLCGAINTQYVSCQTKEKHREINRRSRQKLKAELMVYYGGKCACCGAGDLDILSIDHINGGGTKHIEEIGGGGRLYKWLRDNGYPDGYRVLCMNCNKSRGAYGYCPHQTEGVCQI